MNMLYIGPGMGITSIVLIFLIAGIVLVAFGYIIWLKIKNIFKKKLIKTKIRRWGGETIGARRGMWLRAYKVK